MKTILLTLALACIGVSVATAGIVNSKHDFSSTSTGGTKTSSSQTCVFCHSPHNALLQTALWNRSTSTATTYQTYYGGPTSDMTSASTRCLSCHDGTIAITSLHNSPEGALTVTSSTNVDLASGKISGGPALLSTDLRDDHPVGRALTVATTYKVPTNVTLYDATGKPANTGGNKVECGSCHDPHLTTNGKFLRTSNSASALCMDCHIK